MRSTPALLPELEEPQTHETGILNDRAIRRLVDSRVVHAPVPVLDGQVQPASLDLRLGDVAYEVRASFLPTAESTVLGCVEGLRARELDLARPAVLERGRVYIIPLIEELRLPQRVSAKANPKSTTGRVDVFTRLITDHGDEFERVPAGYVGRLYAEVAPRTFSVIVHQGTRLNQLRFLLGKPQYYDKRVNDLHESVTLLYSDDGDPASPLISNGLWISVDLKGDGASDVVGYRARHDAEPIDLDQVGHYDPAAYWEAIARPANRQIVLGRDEFYILASKERVRVPATHAAEMVGYDPSVGEFRIHYAGFFDPGFGYGSDDVKGTRAVLEVRSHEVPFVLRDGQRVARFLYERLIAPPDRVYGAAIGSSYQQQGLALSKQFKK